MKEMANNKIKIPLSIKRCRQSFWENNDISDNAPYLSPTPGEFPIIAYSPFPHKSTKDGRKVTIKDIRDVTDCGFNVGMVSLKYDQMDHALFLINSYQFNFKSILGSPFLINGLDKTNNYQTFINHYINNIAVGGWNLKDEPNQDEFQELSGLYHGIREYDPTRMVYINLLGGLNEGYETYLSEFQELFSPGIWPYDLYPIYLDQKDGLLVRYERFYKDFEICSKIANETGRPFWAFVLSMQHTVEGKTIYPAPKEEYMRFEAFTALAFGAQGILYWSYALRENAPGKETYYTALVDLDGNKTEYWYYAQKINAEIRNFSTIFYGSKFISCRHLGSGIPDYPSQSIFRFGPILYASSPDKGAVFTILNNEGSDYLIMVNRSPFETSVIDIEFSSDYIIHDLTNCKESDFSDASQIYSGANYLMRLDAGQYKIFAFAGIPVQPH